MRSVDDLGMRGDGCGCVHKAGKMIWGSSPFSICPSLNPCHWCDGQALKQAGGHFAVGGNREQSVMSHYCEQTDRSFHLQICDPATCWAGNGTGKTVLSGKKSSKQQVDRCEYCSRWWEEIAGVWWFVGLSSAVIDLVLNEDWRLHDCGRTDRHGVIQRVLSPPKRI